MSFAYSTLILSVVFIGSLIAPSNAQIVVTRRRSSRVGRIIGGCIAAAVLLLLLLCLCAVMLRRRRARAMNGTGQGPPPNNTLWGGKPLFGGPWGRSNFNDGTGYNGPNAPQGNPGYQPSYNNNLGGGVNQPGAFSGGAPPPPPYQGGAYGPNQKAGQNYPPPPGAPPAAYTKGQ